MKARPILFSGPMVRALLAGTKTQTRRIVKPQPANDPTKHHPIAPYRSPGHAWNWVLAATGHGTGDPFPCPYGVPGDLLWVKERCFVPPAVVTARDLREGADTWPKAIYAAEDLEGGRDMVERCSWRHRVSIHMPRAVSRLTLEITEVRVERLQDISEADARAEGASECANGWWFDRTPALAGSDARGAYYCLWESINGPGSWAANPWVWCVGFRCISKNVDTFNPTP